MVSPLDRKLMRDLWRMKGQVIAIGAVIAAGVTMLVMMTGLSASLIETRDAYYDRYRLADVFAPTSRAPERLGRRLAAIPGVSMVQTRVVGQALIRLSSQTLPVRALAVSLPESGRPALNDVYLTGGRMPDSGQHSEILLLRSFAAAHGLRPGDEIDATMSGTRRTFRIVGLARSPEFLYTTAPGELVPDDARFGVIWMGRPALAAAYEMKGAFNEALLGLAHGASEEAILDAADRLLEPYGGSGAYTLAEQISNRIVSEEILGLQAAARGVPPIFLAVAAFLLYIFIGRMVQSEREEIGLMKAFGYTSTETGGHYFKLILVIAAGGALAGCLGGIALGRVMIGIYTDFFKFPFLVFQLDPASFVIGVTVSVMSASAGGFLVLRRVFALTPASAMRPPSPPDYSRSGRVGSGLIRLFDQPSRMVLRRVTRQPVRMAAAATGIACGMALSVAMISIHAGFARAMDLTFSVVNRSDVTVGFTHPVGGRSLFELRRVPGVERAEPVRYVPAVLRHGRRVYRGVLTGLPATPELNRALDSGMMPVEMPENGIVLSEELAGILGVEAGETLIVDVREGSRPVLEIPVSGIVETLLGSPAFMDIAALNRILREPGRASGTFLAIDENHAEAIYERLRDMPAVAGFSLKSEARDAFTDLMNSGAGATRYIMSAIAFIIAFGIVYNAARIAFAERARDLACLRVIGFTGGETAFVLLGELIVVTLAALPVGSVLGHYLSLVIAEGFSTELYRVPSDFDPASHGLAMLVVLTAALVSGWLVKRDLDRSDPVEVLKTGG